MRLAAPQGDRCFILVKALPHRSNKYAESVCCAGIGSDGRWRRLYPVQFRILDDEQKFTRWQWIEYEFVKPSSDQRFESQKVIPETIRSLGMVKPTERARVLNPLILGDLGSADAKGQSLALVRPRSIKFTWRRKEDAIVEAERRKHAELANQLSLLDNKQAPPLTPSPFLFRVQWTDAADKSHSHVCDDWETSTAYFVRRRANPDDETALNSLKTTYESDYLRAGVALAFSTHSRRNVTYGNTNQWLLVGIIRIDETPQGDLFLGR